LTTPLKAALAILAFVAATLGLASPAGADAPAPDRRQAKFEIDFMMMTIDHHFAGVKMGELCVQKTTAPPPSSDATLRSTCEEIVRAQTEQIEILQSWLQDWYGVTEEPSVPPNSRQTLRRLAELEGEPFDVQVSEDFIRHHRTFLPDAERCTQVAYHDELRDLCAQMYETQLREIGIFESILRDHGERPDARSSERRHRH